ncbi:MAG: PAS domain-containing protein, partial [Chloroflexi bacterium]|nr:PAS domain-containing protein [Chloroflexota bacterium]
MSFLRPTTKLNPTQFLIAFSFLCLVTLGSGLLVPMPSVARQLLGVPVLVAALIYPRHVYIVSLIIGALVGFVILTVDEGFMLSNLLSVLIFVSVFGMIVEGLFLLQQDRAYKQAQLSAVLTASNDGIVIWDELGMVVFANVAAAAICGRPLSEMIGQPIAEIAPPACPLDFSAPFPPQMAELRGQRMILPFDQPDGSVLQVGMVMSDASFADGIVFSAVLQDMSREQEDKQALAKSEARYRLLFNKANDAIAVHTFKADQNTGQVSFVEINEVGCRLLGYTREEFLS